MQPLDLLPEHKFDIAALPVNTKIVSTAPCTRFKMAFLERLMGIVLVVVSQLQKPASTMHQSQVLKIKQVPCHHPKNKTSADGFSVVNGI